MIAIRSAMGKSGARHSVPTVPRVGCRRPLSRSRSVLGSMSAASVSWARVHPRRIRSRSTTSGRTCHPTARKLDVRATTDMPLRAGRGAMRGEGVAAARDRAAPEGIAGDFVGNFIPSTPCSAARNRHKRVHLVLPFPPPHDAHIAACVTDVAAVRLCRAGAEISAPAALLISSWLDPDIDTHSGTSPVGVRSSGP